MKNYLKSIPVALFFLCLSTHVFSQSFDKDKVKMEIEQSALLEQDAFKNGRCEEVLNLMSDDITFLANGRKVPSKMVVGKFCNSIPRPFKTATLDQLEIIPLSETSGYVIRTLEYPKDEETNTTEYVTKIWKKMDGEWKITHLHSTVKEVPVAK
ncbi:nuclear transport factor 2 family protein [Croceiramulus getboli]|nr:nuclear transport factor 2 family protein [Flavobacteriaceae bacterium YJPT1-3]